MWRGAGGPKARGSGFAYEPRVNGRRVPKHHMRKRRDRAEWVGSVPPGRKQARWASGEGHRAGEAVQLLEARGMQSQRYRECDPRTAFRVREA